MTGNETIKIKPEDLECIYNLHSVCEALIYDNINSASMLFEKQVKKVSNCLGGNIPEVEGMVLITSLNRCLYDFFQFYMHVSLTECCWKNRVKAGTLMSNDDILKFGLRVLKDYNECFKLKGEACNHFKKARIYIHEHIEGNLSLKTVSEAIHISEGYLCRIFSSLSGQTFNDYVREARIAFSRKLLSGTDLTIDIIAEKCGFNTPNYFSTVFKQYMGQSPVTYRKSCTLPSE